MQNHGITADKLRSILLLSESVIYVTCNVYIIQFLFTRLKLGLKTPTQKLE